MTMKLTILKDDPSKAEEIAWIRAIAAAIPTNSYLHMLFSPNFLNRLEYRIKADESVDFFHDLEVTEALRNNAESMLAEHRQRVSNLEMEIESLREDAENNRVKTALLQSACDDVNKDMEAMRFNANERLTMNKHYVAQLKAMDAMLEALVMDRQDDPLFTAARMYISERMNR